MRDQKINKIKKAVFILLAVFLVVSLTAASASAWYSKTSDGKCKEVAKEKVIKEAKEKPVKEAVRERVFDRKVGNEKLGSELLGFVETSWFSIGRGANCDNFWGGNCDSGWFGDDWDDCWDC